MQTMPRSCGIRPILGIAEEYGPGAAQESLLAAATRT